MADSIFKQIGSVVKNLVDSTKSELQANITAITPTSLGLGNVNNTSDANKPVSTAQQTALNGKQDVDSRLVFDGSYVHTDNNYTTTEKTKLSGIESGATGDQTAAEIKTAYESNANTNVFADADKSKLGGIEAGAQVNTVTSVAGRVGDVTLNIADLTIDGHVVPTADITYDLGSATNRFRDLWLSSSTIKMGDFGISVTESGTITTSNLTNPNATTDVVLTDTDIGVLVQGYDATTVHDGVYVHTDNNYTTPEKTKVGYLTVTQTVDLDATRTKLAGIESGATADQTADEILVLIKTVDGAGSGLDADLLDGQTGTYYTSYTDTKIAALVNSSPAALDTLNELATALGNDPNFATTMTTQLATKLNASSYTAADVLTKVKTVDGVGSGLDADLLDGQEGTYYQPVSTAVTTSTSFGGDVSGTYNNIVVTDNSHNHTSANISDATSANTVSTIVKRDASGNFSAGTISAALSGNATTATTASNVAWSGVGSKPTTVAGYGITDAALSTHNHTVDALSNVTITTKASGDLLKWNGTAWVNSTLAGAGIQASATAVTTSTTFGGDVSGTYNNIVVADDSHNHTIATVTGLQTALDSKLAASATAATASKWATSRTITLAGDLTGSVLIDGSTNVTLSAEVVNDSHTHDLTYVKTTGGSITGNLTVNGTLSATDLVETSSIRFKENVQPLVDPIGKISALQGVSYNWKQNGVADIGFIAEEVEKIIPELVSRGDDGEVSGMNYGKLTALLVEAIKIQQAQIAELQKLIK